MAAPTFRVLDDHTHFEWSHTCRGQITGEPFDDVTTMPHSGGTWQVVQVEPLTVTPSINCTACGTHGWIRNGQWVPA